LTPQMVDVDLIAQARAAKRTALADVLLKVGGGLQHRGVPEQRVAGFVDRRQCGLGQG